MAWSWNPRKWFRSEEERSISFQDVWGSGRDTLHPGVSSMEGAVTLAPVFAATRLVSDNIASLPVHAFRGTADKSTQVPLPPFLVNPTVYGTDYEWKQRLIASLMFRGNAYGYIYDWDRNDFPSHIEWLHPDTVTIADDRTVVAPQWYWEGRPIDPSRMVHIPWHIAPGRVLGFSPIAAYAASLETGLYSQQFARDWFKNGAIPSAVLETDQPVDHEQAKRIKANLKQAADGREPIVLGAGTSYKPITIKPQESQFLETIQASANQIAAIYGVPPEMIGGKKEDSLTYATEELNAIKFVQFTLRPYLVKLESHFNQLIPRGQFVKFNADAIVRADLKTRYQAHALALQHGFKTVNEVRSLEDLPPVPGGDTIQPAQPKGDPQNPQGGKEESENE